MSMPTEANTEMRIHTIITQMPEQLTGRSHLQTNNPLLWQVLPVGPRAAASLTRAAEIRCLFMLVVYL